MGEIVGTFMDAGTHWFCGHHKTFFTAERGGKNKEGKPWSSNILQWRKYSRADNTMW